MAGLTATGGNNGTWTLSAIEAVKKIVDYQQHVFLKIEVNKKLPL